MTINGGNSTSTLDPSGIKSGRSIQSELSNHPTPRPHAATFAVLPGRALFVAIFLMASLGDFSRPTIEYAAKQSVPLASIAVPLSGLIAIAGGLSVLLGYKARIGACLLILFLVPVTLQMHRFWTISDPAAAQIQQIMFMKNLSMLGGALLITYFGSGPMSLDAWLQARSRQRPAPARA